MFIIGPNGPGLKGLSCSSVDKIALAPYHKIETLMFRVVGSGHWGTCPLKFVTSALSEDRSAFSVKGVAFLDREVPFLGCIYFMKGYISLI